MIHDVDAVANQIEFLRRQLDSLGLEKERTDPEMVRLSQLIDKKLNLYYRLKKEQETEIMYSQKQKLR